MTVMQPESSHNETNIEHVPTPPSIEVGEAVVPSTSAETGIEKTPEYKERMADTSSALADATAVSTPVQPQLTDDDLGDDVNDTTSPVVAADQDVIEKEWVDSSKKIIAETQGDPHKRSKRVGKLHADYLKKRYGKELKPAETT